LLSIVSSWIVYLNGLNNSHFRFIAGVNVGRDEILMKWQVFEWNGGNSLMVKGTPLRFFDLMRLKFIYVRTSNVIFFRLLNLSGVPLRCFASNPRNQGCQLYSSDDHVWHQYISHRYRVQGYKGIFYTQTQISGIWLVRKQHSINWPMKILRFETELKRKVL
jgi:hypothetical protein